MQLTLLHGYPDMIGRRRVIAASATGPTSYTQFAAGPPVTGGDSIQGLPFQFYIDDMLGAALSTDGTTMAIFQPLGTGARQTWIVRYFAFTSSGLGAESNTGTNLSTKKFQVSMLCGTY